ncbi:helix-turn-helix domain-containing protein [Hyphomicrobium sp. DY-1]|uniref:helix-turn-helix domain-containing protein n=1 Tax=Hyphomicrobium sp. DY-1 TaxID=3075650 RepID=UPI0039C44D41
MRKRDKSKNGQEKKVELSINRGPIRLDEFDATAIVGLRVIVHDAVIQRVEEDGEASVEVPKIPNLMATTAVIRCLKEVKLRGWEIRAMRKIMGMNLEDLAKKLGERTAVETLSRWESEKQPIGGYAEKVLRLLICEELRKAAPGVSYDAGMIANLTVIDPWILDPDYEVPYIQLGMIKVKACSGGLIEAYDTQQEAA